MKNKYSIVSRINYEQAEELEKELLSLGYKKNETYPLKKEEVVSITSYQDGTYSIRHKYVSVFGNPGEDHIAMEEYNKELFLALASQWDNNEFHIKEYVRYDSLEELPNNCYRIDSDKGGITLQWLYDYGNIKAGDTCYYGGTLLKFQGKDFKKLTKEELFIIFKNQKTTIMTPQKFTVGSKSKAIREAFCKELKERGYSAHSDKTEGEFINNESYCLCPVTDPKTKQYQRETEKKNIHFDLPTQWNEALTAWEEYSKITPKKESKIYEISHNDGSLYFNITQGKSIEVYTDEDDARMNEEEEGEYLGEITKSQLETVISNSKKPIGQWGEYEIVASGITIGCKVNMAIEDFEELLKIYNEVNA